MFRSMIPAVLACTLFIGAPSAQLRAQQTTATEDAKKAGKEAKVAGKHTGEAAKDGAKATGKGVKHVAKKTAKGTKKVAGKAKDAVTEDPVKAMCADGKVHDGKTAVDACADHGGVR